MNTIWIISSYTSVNVSSLAIPIDSCYIIKLILKLSAGETTVSDNVFPSLHSIEWEHSRQLSLDGSPAYCHCIQYKFKASFSVHA